MRDLLNMILRSPEDGGGAGNGGAGNGAAGGGSGGDGAPAAPAGADKPPSMEGSGDAGPYRPDGLPDDWIGASERETIDRLAKVAKGYRDRDSKAGVPEDVAEYRQFGEVEEKLKPYFQTLEGDGMFDDVAAVAKEHGISKPAFQAIVGKYMSAAADMGILEPPVDKSAERAALLPDGAENLPKSAQDQAIDRRMSDNLGWLSQMKDRGLGEDAIDHMVMMLGDSAKGHKAIEFFRSQISGEANPRPAGNGAGAGKADPAADLSRRSALPENDPNSPKFDRASYDVLQADYKRVHGD